MIERDGEDFVVPAELLAEALLVPAAEVPAMLRDGRIRTRAEEGVGEDAGRFRLSFETGRRRLRLVVDADGEVINRSTVDFGQERPRG